MAVVAGSGYQTENEGVQVNGIEDGRIRWFNQRPALAGLLRVLRIPKLEAPRNLPVSRASKREPRSIRALIGIGTDPTGAVITTAEVSSDDYLIFWGAEGRDLVSVADATCRRLAQAMPEPDALLVFSCLGRREHLKENTGMEARLAKHHFKRAPVAGLWGYGEFAGEFLNYHYVIVGLRENFQGECSPLP